MFLKRWVLPLDIRRGVVQQTTQDFTERHAAHFDFDAEPIAAKHELVVCRNRETGNSTYQSTDGADSAPKAALATLAKYLVHAQSLIRASERRSKSDYINAKWVKSEVFSGKGRAENNTAGRPDVRTAWQGGPDTRNEVACEGLGRARDREALSMPDTVTEATDVVRGHIDRIVLTRVGDTLRAELHGGRAVLASFAQPEEHKENALVPEKIPQNCRWLRGTATVIPHTPASANLDQVRSSV